MKALTVSQPFASLIARGEKFVENRVWGVEYRGLLAIHAGKGTQYLARRELAEYPTQAVVAVATLRTCLMLNHARRSLARGQVPILAERQDGLTLENLQRILAHEYTEGPWCFVLEWIRPFARPIAAKGRMGLWEWTPPLDWESLLKAES